MREYWKPSYCLSSSCADPFFLDRGSWQLHTVPVWYIIQSLLRFSSSTSVVVLVLICISSIVGVASWQESARGIQQIHSKFCIGFWICSFKGECGRNLSENHVQLCLCAHIHLYIHTSSCIHTHTFTHPCMHACIIGAFVCLFVTRCIHS